MQVSRIFGGRDGRWINAGLARDISINPHNHHTHVDRAALEAFRRISKGF